ncbi:MAG TPA: hypothetical protein VN670_07045 [Acidobacteriaceae bacterium]|nr:hypothetical protein [Acidobacteriaceae bacterium]
MGNCVSVLLISAVFYLPAFATVTINQPSSGETVSSPFSLSASSSSCSSQPTRSMGYSIDNSHDTTILRGTSLDVKLASSTGGPHKVHVKAWGNQGAVCVADVAITVLNAAENASIATAETSLFPANATSVRNLERHENWIASNDSSSDGNSSGQTRIVDSPTHDGPVREFTTSYTDSGSQRYSIFFGNDTAATNFVYDAWVYIPQDSSGHIANLELDLNQGMSNGQTVIYGFQCDGYSNTWDYSENQGTPRTPKGNWVRSQAKCNPRRWSTDQWHHVQISFSRDSSGVVTYNSVSLDGTQSSLNATALGARALGWRPNLSVNFQVDGLGASGTTTLYVKDLTVYRW